MSDIKLVMKDFAGFFQSDCELSSNDLALDDSLETAIILSLFLDARAKDDDVLPEKSADKRGWWADSVFSNVPDNTGSRLWLLSREKTLPEVLKRAKSHAEEALAWLIEDKRAKAITVNATMPSVGLLHLDIEITLPDGTLYSTNYKRKI